MLENYLVYLQLIDEKLNKFFTKQKPFIYCKKGCGLCCKNAQFPYSQIELEYLMIGVRQLDEEKKSIISQNINKLKQQKAEHPGKDFKYDCPFLINNECSVYSYRGIVCRTFGLGYYDDTKDCVKLPECVHSGLNYSEFYDSKSGTLSIDDVININLRIDRVLNSRLAQVYNFECGDIRPMLEWLEQK